MKKLFISCLVAILSIGLFAVSTVNAASDVSQLFKEFMDECFSDETNVTVFMGNQDVTKEFFDRYRDMYSNNELLIISNDIEYYGYDITHEIDMPVTRASTTKSKTFKSYETKTVKGNKKEWTTILYCKFTYNPSTGNITSISNPQLNVDLAHGVVLLHQDGLMLQLERKKWEGCLLSLHVIMMLKLHMIHHTCRLSRGILGIVHVHIHLRSNLWKSLLLQSSV